MLGKLKFNIGGVVPFAFWQVVFHPLPFLYGGPMIKDCNFIHKMFDGRCAYCGIRITLKQLNIDHKLSKSKGGKTKRENLFPSCQACNIIKGVFTIEEFRQRLIDDIRKARKWFAKFRTLERYGLIKVIDKPIVFYFEKVKNASPH